ncbi:MAG: Crp/Fnr family transcriptional regulator [Cytophagaceae bacterium]
MSKKTKNINPETTQEMIKCISDNKLLSPEEVEEISKAIRIEKYKKGSILLKEGEVAKDCYLLLKGCVRQYYVVDGDEKTIFFYVEGQGFSSFKSAGKGTPSECFLECVEDSSLAVISVKKELELYQKFPNFESLSRSGLEEQLGDYQEMLAKYVTSKPEERYLELLEKRPDLIKRIPQYQLASYLGVSPETLSRIRKRIFSKK